MYSTVHKLGKKVKPYFPFWFVLKNTKNVPYKKPRSFFINYFM